MTLARPACRPGLSLMEVLIALAIFLIAMAVLGQMVNLATNRAVQVRQQAQAAQLCQSKLAEVVAGAVPLTSQSEVAFEEDPHWVWTMEAEQAEVANLWRVKIRVSRAGSDGNGIECVMSQMVLDPAVRGSAADTPAAIAGTDASSPTGGTGGSTPSQSGGSR
jgi:type II secretion system protein I